MAKPNVLMFNTSLINACAALIEGLGEIQCECFNLPSLDSLPPTGTIKRQFLGSEYKHPTNDRAVNKCSKYSLWGGWHNQNNRPQPAQLLKQYSMTNPITKVSSRPCSVVSGLEQKVSSDTSIIGYSGLRRYRCLSPKGYQSLLWRNKAL